MGVGKVLWKLKGLIFFVVLILVIVIVVATMINKDKNVIAPEVSTGNVVKDKEPNDSFKSPQKTGLTLNLNDWIQINGKHDKDGDNDKFDFKIANGVNGYEIQCWQEVLTKDNTKKLSVNSSVLFGFPLSLACYDKAGKVVTNILAAGSGNGQNFPEGTVKITASVATVKEKEGPGVHEEGKEYKIYIKGQYKEPKVKKEASSQ